MLKWFIAVGITISGVIVAFAGLVWGAIFVGVPYQDPTPSQAATEKFNLTVSDWGIGIGTLLFLVGALLCVLFGLRAYSASRLTSSRI